jgi:hypothetical protein
MDQNDTIQDEAQHAGATTTTAGDPIAGRGVGGVMPAFLAELARAMQAAAERERERINEVVAAEAAEHVEKARTRAAAETEALRRLADEDLEHIQDWSSTEVERIHREAERRTDERRSGLEAYLAQHDTIIATEIDGVDTAVRDYRVTLDQFFDELMGSTDPAEIARRAGSLPAMPDLDDVRAAARAAAVSELANAPQEVVDTEPGPSAVDADPEPSADAGDEPTAEGWAGTGVGVMDAPVAERSLDVPDILREVDPEGETEPATVPPAGAHRVAAADVAETADHPSSAVRLLRSIAPWTSPSQDNPQNHDGPTH